MFLCCPLAQKRCCFFLLILLNNVYLKERFRGIRRKVKISKQKRERESEILTPNYPQKIKKLILILKIKSFIRFLSDEKLQKWLCGGVP